MRSSPSPRALRRAVASGRRDSLQTALCDGSKSERPVHAASCDGSTSKGRRSPGALRRAAVPSRRAFCADPPFRRGVCSAPTRRIWPPWLLADGPLRRLDVGEPAFTAPRAPSRRPVARRVLRRAVAFGRRDSPQTALRDGSTAGHRWERPFATARHRDTGGNGPSRRLDTGTPVERPVRDGSTAGHRWERPVRDGSTAGHRWERPVRDGSTAGHRWGRPFATTRQRDTVGTARCDGSTAGHR